MTSPVANSKEKNLNVLAARTALVFWIAGWYLKICFDVPYLLSVVPRYPVAYDFFPAIFQNPIIVAIAYFAPFSVAVATLLRREYLKPAAVILLVSTVVMSLHLDTYNDATNVTSFWTAIWLVWFTRHLNDTSAEFYSQARVLAQCVVAIIFLGGVVGKLTPEYWSGDIVSKIFVGNPNESPLRQVLLMFPAGWQGKLVIFLSWSMIVTEGILALAPLFSYRTLTCFAIPVFAAFSLFSTWRIFSVLLCLAGILAAGLLLENPKRAKV